MRNISNNLYECDYTGTGYSTITAAATETETYYEQTQNYRLQKMNSSVGDWFKLTKME